MYPKEEYQKWSTKQYRQYLQKTAPEGEQETYVGKTIRFFSIFLTKALAQTKLTPNQITVISVLIFMAGISLFLIDDVEVQVLGVLIIYISIIFDASDGEIARLKGNKSGVGSIYTEPVSHDIQYGYMFIPLTLGQYLATGNITIVYVGIVALLSKLWLRVLQTRFRIMKGAMGLTGGGPQTIEDAYRKTSFAQRIFRIINREIFSSVGLITPLLLCVLFERVDLFIWSFALVWLAIFALHFLNQVIYVSKLRK